MHNFWYSQKSYRVVVPTTAATLASLINTATGNTTIQTTPGLAVFHKIFVQAGIANLKNIALGDTPTVTADGSADNGFTLVPGSFGPRIEWMDLNDLKLVSTNGTDTAIITIYTQR